MVRRNTIQKQLKCECCNSVFPIWRKIGRNKSQGHVKHLHCYSCKKVTAHIELDEFKDSINYQLCLSI
jgi:hypothetical protein